MGRGSKKSPVPNLLPLEAGGDEGAVEGCLEAICHCWVGKRVGLVEHDTGIVEVQHLQLGIEHLGDALWGGSVGGLAAAALAEELGAVDNLGDGLAQPRGADDPDNVCRGGGNYRLPGGMCLERESLAAICLGQHIVKALRQLVERLSGGESLPVSGSNTRLADASADKSRACLAGAAGNM